MSGGGDGMKGGEKRERDVNHYTATEIKSISSFPCLRVESWESH